MEEQFENQNDRIAKHIWHDALQRSIKVLSWGLDLSNIKVIENGTAFHVLGKVIGWIKIQYQQSINRFKITISPDNKQENEITYDSVFLNQLVPVIDDTITKGTLYENHIRSKNGITPEIAV